MPHFGQPTAQDYAWMVEQQVPSPNRVVKTFEAHLANYSNRLALATSSGTAALHLALASLGVGAEDEVLCSDFTFAATLNAILYVGAIPVLIDAEPNSWGMAPELLSLALQQRARKGKLPKAVVLTHVLGHCANLPEIKALCQQYHVWLIEDAAGALGSTYEGTPLGSHGDQGILSFNYNKVLSTGGGGALLNSVPSLHERAEYLSNQAKSKKSYYFHKEVGFNYRINGFGAGMGAIQWPSLSERVAKKRQLRAMYLSHLANVPGVQWQIPREGEQPNYWLNGIILESSEMRTQVQALLEQAGIETVRLWKPMHQQPAYAKVSFMSNGTGAQIFERGLALPSDNSLTAEAIAEVCDWIKKGVA